LNEEELAIVNSHDMPPGIEGMNMEALPTFFDVTSLANNYGLGYDPKTDYCKKSFLQSPRKPVSNIWADQKATMIHPVFQRRGFGTYLTRHCNAIADKMGGKTWVSARPTSLNMFRQCGYKDVATHNADLKRFGGNTKEEIAWLLEKLINESCHVSMQSRRK
jgi:hypothetical protein